MGPCNKGRYYEAGGQIGGGWGADVAPRARAAGQSNPQSGALGPRLGEINFNYMQLIVLWLLTFPIVAWHNKLWKQSSDHLN